MSSIRQTKRDTNTTVLTESVLEGEPIMDLTYKRMHLGDGSKLGGIPHANYLDLQHDRMNYAEVSGTNTLTGDLLPVPSSVAAGMRVNIKVPNANTGAVTFNPNALGAIAVKKPDAVAGSLVDLVSGDWVSDGVYELVSNGTYWIWVGAGGGGLSSVSQGDLNTSVGSIFFNTSDEQHYTLPGGTYGFYPTINISSLSSIPDIQMMDSSNVTTGITTASDVAMISVKRPIGSGATLTIKQRYVTSSPPFDMGDGNVGGFIFLHVNKNKDILSAWASDVPPWAYNGPTNIRANKINPKTGAKMRRALNQKTMQDILSDEPAKVEYETITQKIKNADMHLIPHPFGKVNRGEKVLLLNPMDARIAQLIQYQNEGGDLRALFNYLQFDTVRLRRKGPAGVHQVRFST